MDGDGIARLRKRIATAGTSYRRKEAEALTEARARAERGEEYAGNSAAAREFRAWAECLEMVYAWTDDLVAQAMEVRE